MTEILPRSAWTDTPGGAFGGVTPDRTIDPAQVTALVVHWPGDGGQNYAALTKGQVAEKLRGYRRHHTQSNGWADIGYPFAIDMAGRIWEAAGTKHAAAHTAGMNATAMAALLVIGANEAPSEAMLAALEDLRTHLRTERFPGMRELIGHGDAPGASTQCPGPHVNAALFDGPTPTPPPAQEATMPRVTSPVRGYITSHYGQRGSFFHAGLDIGTGGQRRAVHAMFAGTVERVVSGRRNGQGAGSGTVLAAGRSGNGVIVRNPDGERQLYGHVAPEVTRGQKVAVGQRLGTVDMSGITTGLHLHLEIWNAAGRTRNPMIDFRHFGITPGGAPSVHTPPSSGSGSSGGSNGIEWPGSALRVDGHFGPVSRRAYQRLLAPASVGNYTGRIDGQHGPMTTRAEQRWLKSRGHYTGRIDGDRGPMTRRALQNLLRARGFYTGRIDGDLGPMTNRAMQSFLNDQRKHYR